MDKNARIVITGAAGFIGSCLVSFLNYEGYENLILVDDFSKTEKAPNLEGKQFFSKNDRESFDWIEGGSKIDLIFHIGARTDTTEFDFSVLQRLNIDYSKRVWNYCVRQKIPLIYASSAATYGDGMFGYCDSHSIVEFLHPLNPYGISKNDFDKWVLKQTDCPPFWAGLKFFNVYGPNEYHKARMASVIFHSMNQIREKGSVRLFRSHKTEFKDGEQLRDFVYVKDVLKVCMWLMKNEQSVQSGLYNLGTGKARTFNDLVFATFKALELVPKIEYIDMPEDIRDRYQYFTEADMGKLREAGFTDDFYTLEEGINDYAVNYLKDMKYY